MARFDPSLTYGDLKKDLISRDTESVHNSQSFKVYVIIIGSPGGTLEPFLD